MDPEVLPPLDESVAAALAVAEHAHAHADEATVVAAAAAAAAIQQVDDHAAATAAAAAGEKRKASEEEDEEVEEGAPSAKKPSSGSGVGEAGEYEVTFREAELGIILRFETNPTTETFKVYVKEVHGSHAESLGVMAGDEILGIEGTFIATDCPAQQDVLTLIQGTARPTLIRFRRDAADSEGSRAPLTPAAYKARTKAVMEVQEAETEVKRIKHQLAEAVAVQIKAKRKMDAVAPWRSTPWWSTKDDHWAKKYSQLIEHKRVHGTVDISTEDGDLGKWCKAQRKYFNQSNERATISALTPEVAEGRLSMLDDLGFDLQYKEQSKIHQSAWETKFAELVEYKTEQNHCNVPNTRGPHQPLGRWVMKQRGMYQAMLDGDRAKQKGLTQERVDKLNSVGFEWRRGTNPRKGTKVNEWKGGGGKIAERSAKKKAAREAAEEVVEELEGLGDPIEEVAADGGDVMDGDFAGV
mmetsp:Transcript_15378/g.44504  ORF Transcript_15378/g.44504 Transcript_15378/m.44504 type:complete len:468 (-) Transcript_15378:191-1594(-)